MTDRYWEGYRDGCADTRERFLAKRDKEIERLRDENATLLERIDTEPAQWKAAYEQRDQLLQDALDERDKLRAENEKLREWLRESEYQRRTAAR